jgi:general secretion pathway protein E
MNEAPEGETMANQEKVSSTIQDVSQSISSQELYLQSQKAIGSILVETRKITPDQLKKALLKQQESGERVGQLLIDEKIIDQDDLLSALAYQLDLPYYHSLPISDIDASLVRDIPLMFCSNYSILPVSRDTTSVTIAVSDPLDLAALDELRFLFGQNLKRIVTSKKVLEAAITNVYERQDMANSQDALEDDDQTTIDGLDEAHDLLQDAYEAPVRREVNTILRRAITEGASDIHIEPFEEKLVVRFRLDGRMKEIRVIPKKYQSSITTRIKILSKMNIAESRIPQDGRISLKVGSRDSDVRVSCLPVKFGERIVMRILEKTSNIPDLDKMGMPEKVYYGFEKMVQQNHGIILVTGPTGSGKTTTLASALMHVNRPDVTIITVEDPVEIQLPGVSQVEVNEKAGLTFAAALRSILRQNPNTILIGEIRDAETAQIAVQASMTGHLVFSTLHTNDTASSVTRLADFGIESFQITTSVVGVLAVRLVRKLCPICKEKTDHTETELKLLGLTKQDTEGKKLYKARPDGCNSCRHTGYAGRMGIYELLVMNNAIREKIVESMDGAAIKRLAVKNGMTTLKMSAAERFLDGLTTLEEATYATQMEGEDMTKG